MARVIKEQDTLIPCTCSLAGWSRLYCRAFTVEREFFLTDERYKEWIGPQCIHPEGLTYGRKRNE